VNARVVSDNKIQLKFTTKEFEAEYFHHTGDWRDVPPVC
jgi:hypothetical protein